MSDWPLTDILTRARGGLSADAAAARAGVSVGTWRVYESGRRYRAGQGEYPLDPKPDTLYSIATAFDLDAAELFRLVGLDPDELERVQREADQPPVTVGQPLPASGRALAQLYIQLDDERRRSVERHVRDSLTAQIAEEAQEGE